MGADETVYLQLNPGLTSAFVGYEKDEADSTINALTTETEVVTELVAGQRGTIFTAETPFYATSGGQAADAGLITTADAEFEVEDTIKLQGGKIGHVGVVTKGMFKVDETVHLAISKDKRGDTRKNHSATHLLQKALRLVLGSHVEQAGSFVNEERLRFDFTHFSALTKEEISKVEAMVNEQIQSALPVNTNIMTIEEAKKTGAMALFGEKYGDSVRVVTMGEFSKELCGGTHVANTSSILIFKIISETGVAAGVRRIEALTGKGVFNFYEELESELMKASRTAKTEPAQLSAKIEGLQEEIKALQSENEKLKNKLAKDALGDVMNQVKEVSGVKLLAARVEGVDVNNLRNLGDQLKDKLGEGVIILASPVEDKVNLIVMVTDTAIAKGAHAGNLIKELAVLVGGGGGGRPNLAQAGGKNPAGIDALIEAAPKVLEKQIH
jgi:alanyl-tRNA synthetase